MDCRDDPEEEEEVVVAHPLREQSSRMEQEPSLADKLQSVSVYELGLVSVHKQESLNMDKHESANVDKLESVSGAGVLLGESAATPSEGERDSTSSAPETTAAVEKSPDQETGDMTVVCLDSASIGVTSQVLGIKRSVG
jgi:hypothetical protein